MGQNRGRPDQFLSQLERAVLQHLPEPHAELQVPVFPDRTDRLLGVLESLHAWVAEFDGEGRMIYASPQVEAILGLTPEECLADGIVFHAEDMHLVIALGRRVRETGEPARNETRIRHKDGHWVWMDTSVVSWAPSSKGGFHTIAIARDITELKNARAARSESEARYRVVSEMSYDLITEVDEQGRSTYVGPGSERIVGYTADELLEMEPFALLHPEDEERIRAQLAAALAQRSVSGSAGQPATAKPELMEYRVRHRDGRWRWLETLGLTYPRADHETRYLSVTRDMTERKLAEVERRRLEESMQRAQKLESLGVLAGGIAHDFNNLLTPILSAAVLCEEELPEDSPARPRLRRIQQAASRAAALTNQMLAYAGESPLRVERLDLTPLVAEMRELVASSISGQTTLDLQLDPELPPIEAEGAQLSQVVLNLITNAVESLGDGDGHISVRTAVVDVDALPPGALFGETMTSGPHVLLEVSDTGSGMDAQTRERIFDPFYTTKFKGRGLGLAAVAGIVRGHRGAIAVESEPGRGTCFRVLFPALDGRVAGAPSTHTPVGGWRATGTALVIDDDEGVRALAEDILCRTGMTVLTAGDGHEGVRLFAEHADAIRVVLLDRTMPTSSGAETFDAIRAVRGDAKVVLVSGYSEERATADLASRGLAGFLRKPFLPEALVERVRDAMEPLA